MIRFWPILLAFAVLLGVRVYFINQKQNIYGDELTSVSLAFGNPGWGGDTFETERVYTGKELREITYVDSECPEGGLPHDLNSLYHDNDDPSHASIYYMALRCALSGIDAPDMGALVWRGCSLNLIFFCASFLAVLLFLKRVFADSITLQTFCLILAFANPVSISILLFVREYAMAEMFFSMFALWLVNAPDYMNKTNAKIPVRWALCGIVVIACLVSCGYFNGILVALAFSTWGYYCIRKKNAQLPLTLFAIALGAVLLCVFMYRGFFNFTMDDRTMEVSGKLKGGDLISNLRDSLFGIAYIFIKRIFTLPLLCVAFLIATCLCRQKTATSFAAKQSVVWLLGIIILWIVIVLWLATWKSERFISPSVPIFLSIVSGLFYSAFGSDHKSLLGIVFVIVLSSLPNSDNIEHLEKTDSRAWMAGNEKRIYLYGPNTSEINTMNQLIPYIGDAQECVIIKNVAEISDLLKTEEGEIHVFGYKGCKELKSQDNFVRCYGFNTWMDDYIFR